MSIESYVERIVGGLKKEFGSEIQDTEATAAAAWASIETSFNTALPTLAGQGLALLEALLTGGEVAAAALLPVDAAVDLVTAKTALTTAVSTAKALLPIPAGVETSAAE